MKGKSIHCKLARTVCAGAVVFAASASFGQFGPPTPICKPNFGVACPAVYDPVICDDGNTYSNLCVAVNFHCATGCESTGGGVIFFALDGTGNTNTGDGDLNDVGFAGTEDTAAGAGEGADTAAFGGFCVPDFTILCAAVYDPVVCDDGNTYSNLCVAENFFCATGCVSTGGGVIFIEAGDQGSRPSTGSLDDMDPVGTELATQSAATDSGTAESNGFCVPDFTILCEAIFNPVICDDGNTYPNQCVAENFFCATGCEPTGGGVVVVPF